MFAVTNPFLHKTDVLDQASQHDSQTQWWIKADGCDVLSGLAESMRGMWSGDVDLADGELQRKFQEYQQRLMKIQSLAFTTREETLQNLCYHLSMLQDDQEFLISSKCIELL